MYIFVRVKVRNLALCSVLSWKVLLDGDFVMTEKVTIRMTMQEFIERFEEQPFELINGKIHPIEPELFGHVLVRHNIYNHLLLHYRQMVEVFARTVFVIADSDEIVLRAYVPDVMGFDRERLERYEIEIPDSDDKPLVLVPDLAVEVISPNDSYSKVSEKIETYLSDGVRLLWIVDPQRKTIAVYEGSDTPKTLREGNKLSGGSVLPEFTLSVNEVFG